MATTPRPITETPNQTLLNRELSWLDLNKRVLDLAADPGEPLLERVKFCAIFSSNLDEFFMVRVAGLLDQVIARVNVRSPDGRTPQQALADVRERVLELTSAQSKLWRDELVPALAAEGIVIGTVEDLNEDEHGELEAHFVRQIYPVLTPLAVGPGQPFPYISGLSLSLGVTVRDPDSGEERFARVKVPETLPRFVAIGDRGLMIPLEGVISHHLSSVFPGMELTERAAFRVTRDGDTEISDDADDLLEAVESELRKRRFGAVVRLEVSSSISRAMVARLTERLAVRPDAVYPVHGLLDLREVMQLYDLDRPDLKYEPWVPQTQRRLAKPKDGDLFAEIASSDIVVQHPYDSFGTSVEALRPRRRQGSRGRDPEDDRLPHEPRLGARAGADRGGRERQAERLHRRAEGALRRAPEHRVGALARAGRRPRGLRVPRPEDPRQDDARDPARGRRRSSATSTSAPATTTRPRRGSTRTSGCSPPTRRSRPTSPTSSTSSPASGGRARSARSSSRRSTCAASSSSGSAPSAPRPRPASTPGSGSRSTTSPTRRSSRSSTRRHRQAPRST